MKYISQELFNMLSLKKAFIFDFDETMASTEQIMLQTLKALCKSYGYTYTQKDYREVQGKPSSEYFEQFKRLVNCNKSDSEVLEQYMNLFEEKLKTTKLKCYNYVKEITKLFPNKTYCIASNNIEVWLKQRICDFKLEKFFKHIFACGTGDMNKQYVYQNTQALFGEKPQNCVLFEDTQKYIDEAKSAKITTVGICHQNKEIDADYYVDVL